MDEHFGFSSVQRSIRQHSGYENRSYEAAQCFHESSCNEYTAFSKEKYHRSIYLYYKWKLMNFIRHFHLLVSLTPDQKADTYTHWKQANICFSWQPENQSNFSNHFSNFCLRHRMRDRIKFFSSNNKNDIYPCKHTFHDIIRGFARIHIPLTC